MPSYPKRNPSYDSLISIMRIVKLERLSKRSILLSKAWFARFFIYEIIFRNIFFCHCISGPTHLILFCCKSHWGMLICFCAIDVLTFFVHCTCKKTGANWTLASHLIICGCTFPTCSEIDNSPMPCHSSSNQSSNYFGFSNYDISLHHLGLRIFYIDSNLMYICNW